MTRKQILFSSTVLLVFLNACAQNTSEQSNSAPQDTMEVSSETTEEDVPFSQPHAYGGWYCPDNFGFAPVDIQNIHEIPVIRDRMPTKEETQNGTSLMYLAPSKFPEAQPMDIPLPALIRVKTPYKEQKELAVAIQAFVAGKDSIVGYRFINGGNGSARYQQVEFVSKHEASQLKSTPFVFKEIVITASKAEIWKAFTQTDLAKALGKKFKEKALYKSEWTDSFDVNLEYHSDREDAMGYVAAMWGNLYLHIDSYKDGQHTSQKMLVYEDSSTGITKLIFAAGPYPETIAEEDKKWTEWLVNLQKNAAANH